MLRVGINGYGTIGKRVADAVRAQPDMTVGGVAKRHPDYVARGAVERGYPLYTIDGGDVASSGGDARSGGVDASQFRDVGVDVAGTVDELVEASDVIVDATPAGVGGENRRLYEHHGTPAIFQGGEDAAVAEVSFNARANFAEAADAEYVRVVSCNTTGLARILAPLSESFGVERARATLVRRGGDPTQTGRGPINDVVPDPVTIPSHHGPDLQTVCPGLSVDTIGLTVPTTQMHVHAICVTLDATTEAEAVADLFREEDRILLVPGHAAIDGAGTLTDLAHDAGRPRGDVWENCVWTESIAVRGRDLYCLQAIHQESNVVPENVDAIRSMTGRLPAEGSVALTNETLGVGISSIADRRDPTYASGQAD